MACTIVLKGPWSPDGLEIDKGHCYFKDKDGVTVYDNDYQSNKRWYPIENIARIDDK